MESRKAQWHTIILFVMIMNALMMMFSTFVGHVTNVHNEKNFKREEARMTAQINRCPDYLQNQAKVYIDNIEEFYDYVCSYSEVELAIPAQFLLMCMMEYSAFNYHEGLTLFSDPTLSAVDQVKELQFRKGLDAVKLYALLVEGIFHLEAEDSLRISNRIQEAYPTVYRIDLELRKQKENRK